MIRGSVGPAAFCGLILAMWTACASAQDPDSLLRARETERATRQSELEELTADLNRRKQLEAKLQRDIEALKDDRKKLNQALLDAATRSRSIEQNIGATEGRLGDLNAREQEIARSLDSRRELLAEVLAALVRLGRQPSPALLAKPGDALQSVRSAILLGAMVPELREQTRTLLADLAELARLRDEIAAQRASLDEARRELEAEQERLRLLIEERQRRQAESEQTLASERARLEGIAKQVETVRDLVARMEQEIAVARRQAEIKASLAALSDPGRISPALPFAAAKGRLPKPVSGTLVRAFGAPDGLGGSEKGISIETRPGALVTSPCDGWVVYAGVFRSYGRLLIIHAGGGYHVLLAGMERITVELGQFVLTGEPVAVMGSVPRTVPAAAVSASQPILYVEFRKDGNSIDPSPWWAAGDEEKVRG